MKKCLLSLMAVGLMATAANAATIGLRWSDTAMQDHDGPGTVEVYVDLLVGDSLSGVNGLMTCISGACDNLRFTNPANGLTNWTTDISNGDSIAASAYFTSFSGDGPANLAGPLSAVVGTFDVGFIPPADGSVKGFGISFPQTAVGAGALDGSANAYLWDARYNASYAGYIAFGDYGNPGWGTKTAKGHQPTANPLLITKIPEPTSLALVALGGFALLRRRR